MMPKAAARDPIYRGRRFPADTIELCIRWYLTYRLSYRDLAAMMGERGIAVSHTTILRWVLHYVPEYERRWARFARPTGTSWRMDETVVRVRGGRHWLYRAVDRDGKTVHSQLSDECTIDAAQAFLQTATARPNVRWPRSINLDGNRATHQSLALLRSSDDRWRSVDIRENRYVNNRIEQDHRAIKQRCASMLGHKSFASAATTLAGIELAHRIRKDQFSLPPLDRGARPSLKQRWEAALHQSPADSESVGALPPMQQNSTPAQSPHRVRGRARSPRRFAVTVLLGQSLYLVVAPNGTRSWRYKYQHQRRRTSMSLGEYPLVSLEAARLRQQAARDYLAAGVDPRTRKRALRRITGDTRAAE